MDDIEGIDWTEDIFPDPTGELDGWILLSPSGLARFVCEYVEGEGWAWRTLRRKPDRED